MTVALDSLYLAHVFYYTTVSFLRSRLAPYIPSAKAGGFTALFCKTNNPLDVMETGHS